MNVLLLNHDLISRGVVQNLKLVQKKNFLELCYQVDGQKIYVHDLLELNWIYNIYAIKIEMGNCFVVTFLIIYFFNPNHYFVEFDK